MAGWNLCGRISRARLSSHLMMMADTHGLDDLVRSAAPPPAARGPSGPPTARRLPAQLEALGEQLPRAKSLALCQLANLTQALHQHLLLTKDAFQHLVLHILGEDIVVLQQVGCAFRQRRSRPKTGRSGAVSKTASRRPKTGRCVGG